MEPILKVEALTKTFSGQREIAAVNGISFELFPGECLAIIGESGSGKSTTAYLAAGLLLPDKGEVIYRGGHLQMDARLKPMKL